MAQEFKNKGPIYTTAAKYEQQRVDNQLEVGREYRIVDWEAQEKLVSGTNIKTINTQSILGNGNIELSCAEYTIIKDNDKYYLAKDGTKIDTSVIDIPKDLVVESGKLVDHEIEGVTKKCIEITFNDSSKDKIYIPVDELVDTYTGSDTIDITNNVISVKPDVFQTIITTENKLSYNLLSDTPEIPVIKDSEGGSITELQTETVSDILGVVSVVEENNTNIVTSGGVYDAIKDLGKCLPEFPEDKTKSYSLKLIPENGELKLTWVADTTINDI